MKIFLVNEVVHISNWGTRITPLSAFEEAYDAHENAKKMESKKDREYISYEVTSIDFIPSYKGM